MSKSNLPFEEVAAETFPKQEPNPPVTATLSYDQVKAWLSGKPLRRPARRSLQGSAAPMPSYEQLGKWADAHQPPQSWYEEGEQGKP
jgi:hypothetical protein